MRTSRGKMARSLLATAALWLQPVTAYAQQTFIVDTLAPDFDGGCGTECDDFDGGSDECFPDCSLQDAVAAAGLAPGNDTINFAAGLAGMIDLVSDDSFGRALVLRELTLEGPADRSIELNALGAPISIHSAVVVRNLVMHSGPIELIGDGIFNDANPNAVENVIIEDCYIGTTPSGACGGGPPNGVFVEGGPDAGSPSRGLIFSRNVFGCIAPEFAIALASEHIENVIIEDNLFGTDPSGTAYGPATEGGVYSLASNLVVSRNTIASSHAIRIVQGRSIIIEENHIGTDASRTRPLGNVLSGLVVDTAEFLVITGNAVFDNYFGGPAIHIAAIDVPARFITIGNNLIGSEPLRNRRDGIVIEGDVESLSLVDNVVGGNDGIGIHLRGGFSGEGGIVGSVRNVSVSGNRIGLDSSAFFPAPNNGTGLAVEGPASGIVIDFNIIANNAGPGVLLSGDSFSEGANTLSDVFIDANIIGVNAGMLPHPNDYGVVLAGDVVDVNVTNNLISSNRADGILVTGGFTFSPQQPRLITFTGNFIGTAGGIATVGNGGSGINFIGIDYRSLGDALAPGALQVGFSGAGNTISNNLQDGVRVTFCALEPERLVLQGNVIGAGPNGNGNGGAGVRVEFSDGVLVGSRNDPGSNRVYGGFCGEGAFGADDVCSGNVISGNGEVVPVEVLTPVGISGGSGGPGAGVHIIRSDRVQVYGNLIGTTPDGEFPAPNLVAGVVIDEAGEGGFGGDGAPPQHDPGALSGISIGSSLDVGFGNLISGNGGNGSIGCSPDAECAGIKVFLSANVAIHHNTIGLNGDRTRALLNLGPAVSLVEVRDVVFGTVTSPNVVAAGPRPCLLAAALQGTVRIEGNQLGAGPGELSCDIGVAMTEATIGTVIIDSNVFSMNRTGVLLVAAEALLTGNTFQDTAAWPILAVVNVARGGLDPTFPEVFGPAPVITDNVVSGAGRPVTLIDYEPLNLDSLTADNDLQGLEVAYFGAVEVLSENGEPIASGLDVRVRAANGAEEALPQFSQVPSDARGIWGHIEDLVDVFGPGQEFSYTNLLTWPVFTDFTIDADGVRTEFNPYTVTASAPGGGVATGVYSFDGDNRTDAVPGDLGLPSAFPAPDESDLGRYQIAQVRFAPPPAECEGDNLFVYVRFNEITYFDGTQVITSSHPAIQARAGLSGFEPERWPYDPSGQDPLGSSSRGTLFRVYGFRPEVQGQLLEEVGGPARFPVVADPEIPGAYYADLGRPATVKVPLIALQQHIARPKGKVQPFMFPGTRLLTDAERNVPGIMLNRNLAWIYVPPATRQRLINEGRPLRDEFGQLATTGLVQFLGFQQWGGSGKRYREFVDVEVDFPCADVNPDKGTFRTAKQISFEGFKRCQYLDSDPNNDTVRFNDVWAGNVQGRADSAFVCGGEDPRNQVQRTQFAVPLQSVQILSSVNTRDDSTRIYFGAISPPPPRSPVP
jgi:hypothetical protein